MDYDLVKSADRANELQKIAEQKEFELRRTADRLDETNHAVSKAKEENSKQFGDANQL